MKTVKKKESKIKRYVLFVILLAVVCIGAVELAVCAYVSPELYRQITAPVRAGIQRLVETGQNAWDTLNWAASRAAQATSDRMHGALESMRLYFDEPETEADIDSQLVDSTPLAPPPRSKASYRITTLAARHGTQYLTGGAHEIVYYDQTAARWADEPYGSDQIGGYGCGPSAMAMAVSTLTDTVIDPVEMARHCVDHGYWAKRQGSYLSIVPGAAEDFGLECTSIPLEEADEATISTYLATGQLIVALMGPGHFTNGGHFILLRGVTLDGSILVADSASPERSLTTWDLDLILDELSASRSNGAPLWLLSKPAF